MTYSFDPTLSDDVSLVRFHIGDNSEDGYFVDDETIQYWVDAGTVSSAVIACIRYILSQLSRPNFSLDWMSVSGMQEARKGYEALLLQKSAELGQVIITATATISHPYRLDSLQDSDDTTYDASE
jgi:hypothetical protein